MTTRSPVASDDLISKVERPVSILSAIPFMYAILAVIVL